VEAASTKGAPDGLVLSASTLAVPAPKIWSMPRLCMVCATQRSFSHLLMMTLSLEGLAGGFPCQSRTENNVRATRVHCANIPTICDSHVFWCCSQASVSVLSKAHHVLETWCLFLLLLVSGKSLFKLPSAQGGACSS
jgi:hypothetical protein